MKTRSTCATALLLASIVFADKAAAQTKTAAPADGHQLVLPDKLAWKPLHPGSETAVVSGDPAKAGAPFVMRFRYHGAVRIPPHWHPTDENITVLSGTFMVGMGERFDEKTGTAMAAGAYALLPKKMPHFAWTTGDTVLQVHGVGPFMINYVNPADDPNKPAGRK